jgi:hypothetical protein
MAVHGSLHSYGRGSALGSHYRGSLDEVHCRCNRSVQSVSCFQVPPRGFFPDTAFGREQSNSTGGTLTRVAASFTGARRIHSVESVVITQQIFAQGEDGGARISLVDLQATNSTTSCASLVCSDYEAVAQKDQASTTDSTEWLRLRASE